MIDIGLKFYSEKFGVKPLDQGHRHRILYKSIFFFFFFFFLHLSLHSYIIKTLLIDFIIWHDGCIGLKFFLSAIPKLGHGFEVKVTDLFSYKCQSFCLNFKDSD